MKKRAIKKTVKTQMQPMESEPMHTVENPVLPSEVMENFLNDKIKLDTLSNVFMVKSHFLWDSSDGIERYRINVWMEEDVEGLNFGRNYIGHSFFVKYNTEDREILNDYIGG